MAVLICMLSLQWSQSLLVIEVSDFMKVWVSFPFQGGPGFLVLIPPRGHAPRFYSMLLPCFFSTLLYVVLGESFVANVSLT